MKLFSYLAATKLITENQAHEDNENNLMVHDLCHSCMACVIDLDGKIISTSLQDGRISSECVCPAIVSDFEGTTRDVIEVRLTLSGVPVRLADTAGLRETADSIEAEGISRAQTEINTADLVLLVIDGSQPGWGAIADKMRQDFHPPCLIIASKSDKGQVAADNLDSNAYLSVDLTTTKTALKIEKALHSYLAPLNQASQTPIITRARHRDAFAAALASLQHSQTLSWEGDIAVIAEDYRRAASALGRITGHIDVEYLLDHIFSRFCIGK